jgi:hypothetical protein
LVNGVLVNYKQKIWRKKRKMSARLGRNARLYKDGTVIGYGKNISVKASAELIKEYSMDSLEPAIIGAGKQSFHWTCERLYTDGAWMTLLLAGTQFDLIFAPTGSSDTEPYEEWSDCTVLSCERTAGEGGGILEKVEGEATSVTVHEAT